MEIGPSNTVKLTVTLWHQFGRAQTIYGKFVVELVSMHYDYSQNGYLNVSCLNACSVILTAQNVKRKKSHYQISTNCSLHC